MISDQETAVEVSSGREVWDSGDAYEPYVGRWSRLVAREFIDWLGVPPGRAWLDVGCGTGALVGLILVLTAPRLVVGIDPSSGFLSFSNRRFGNDRARFVVGSGQALPFEDQTFNAVVSGLSLNFLPEPADGVAEMVRVARPDGTVAVYVWDYAGAMELTRTFWDAAIALDVRARALEEGRRFPVCRPEPLACLFRDAGLHDIEVRSVDVRTRFAGFDDYWSPFLGGQGPAPTYVGLIDDDLRVALRERLRATLPVASDGSIDLCARAWAIRGTR